MLARDGVTRGVHISLQDSFREAHEGPPTLPPSSSFSAFSPPSSPSLVFPPPSLFVPVLPRQSNRLQSSQQQPDRLQRNRSQSNSLQSLKATNMALKSARLVLFEGEESSPLQMTIAVGCNLQWSAPFEGEGSGPLQMTRALWTITFRDRQERSNC